MSERRKWACWKSAGRTLAVEAPRPAVFYHKTLNHEVEKPQDEVRDEEVEICSSFWRRRSSPRLRNRQTAAGYR